MKSSKGVFVSYTTIALSLMLFAVAVTVTALLVYFLAPTKVITQPTASELKNSDEEDRPTLPSDADAYLLPKHLAPTHYTLRLLPFLELGNFSFDGEVWMDLLCVESASNVTFHVRELLVHESSIKVWKLASNGNVGSEVGVSGHTYDDVTELYVLQLDGELEPSKSYRAYMTFSGSLNSNRVGCYRSSYTDPTGATRWLVATQFHSTDARRCFPCLDEPQLKATFDLVIGLNLTMKAISNMDVIRQEVNIDIDDYIWNFYNTTPPMPTYLVAFVVSDFAMRPADLPSTGIQVWSRSSAINQAEYAKEIAPKILTFFEEHFGIPYSLPKLDIVAIPDMYFNAMENWGLITYRETAMLYTDDWDGVASREHVTELVSHEVSHMWVGDLVTMAWWSDAWLNEGMATYYEALASAHLEPTFHQWQQFVVSDLQAAFEYDSTDSTHPLHNPVYLPADIVNMYDVITYSKGASIVRMMEHFLGTENFNQGITNYLRDLQYSSATQDDLWSHLDAVAPPEVNMHDVMNTWTLQKGYPVVSVTRDYQTSQVTMTQKRFLSSNSSDVVDYKWWIPITFTTSTSPDFTNTKPTHWITNTTEPLIIADTAGSGEWIIVNLQQTGYYRVNYDITNWELLSAQLSSDHSSVHVTNRAQLVDDSLDLAKAGDLPYSTSLDLVSYMQFEEEYVPWAAFFDGFKYISSMFLRTSGYSDVQNYILALLNPRYNQTGGLTPPQDEAHTQTLLRSEVAEASCRHGLDDCVSRAAQEFDQWMGMSNPDNGNSIDPDTRRTVYCTAIQFGTTEEWDFAWLRYLNSNVANEKLNLLTAMTCSRNTSALDRLLEMAITPDSGIRQQDSTTVFTNMADQTVGRDVAFEFLKLRWDDITAYYGYFPGDIITSLAASMNTQDEHLQMEELLEDHPTESAILSSGISIISANVEWMQQNYEDLLAWFQDQR